ALTGPIGLADITDQIGKAGKDIGVIALTDKMDTEVRLHAFDEGASAVELRQPALVVSVVKRQFEQLRARREVRRLEAALRESERRCEVLCDCSVYPNTYAVVSQTLRAHTALLDK